METRKRELVEVVDDYNNNAIYSKFNELTGLNLEFEINQDYGTGCYGIFRFNRHDYPTLEEIEDKIQKYKIGELDKYDYVGMATIFYFLMRKGELPEADILFRVDY